MNVKFIFQVPKFKKLMINFWFGNLNNDDLTLNNEEIKVLFGAIFSFSATRQYKI